MLRLKPETSTPALGGRSGRPGKFGLFVLESRARANAGTPISTFRGFPFFSYKLAVSSRFGGWQLGSMPCHTVACLTQASSLYLELPLQ